MSLCVGQCVNHKQSGSGDSVPIRTTLESNLFDMFMVSTKGISGATADQLFDKADTKLDSRMN